MSNEKNPIGGQNSVSGKKSRRVPRVSEQPGQIFQDQDLTQEDYREMFGTETVSGALGVLFGTLEATVGDAQNHRQLMVSLGAETKPTSILEAMLLTQIFTVHKLLWLAPWNVRLNQTGFIGDDLVPILRLD